MELYRSKQLICPGDYCDVYLTHDSMSVRKAHNAGKNHLRNVTEYYQRKSSSLSCLYYLTSSRNRPRPSTVCHRLNHKLLCRRRSKRAESRHARPRRTREWPSSTIRIPRCVAQITRDGYVLTLVQPGGIPPPFPMNGPPPPAGMPRKCPSLTEVTSYPTNQSNSSKHARRRRHALSSIPATRKRSRRRWPSAA